MALHVMYGDRRNLKTPGQRAANRRSDQQRADQAGPSGVSDAVEFVTADTRRIEDLPDQRQQTANVIPRGQFGNHTAVLGVQGGLAVNDMRKQAPLAMEYRRCSFIAGGLDAEHAKRLLALHRTGFIIPTFSWVGSLLLRGSFLYYFHWSIRKFFMPSIRIRENEPFEIAIRRFKRTCEKAGVLSEVRRREFYEKPTEERKRKAAAAVKRHLKKLSRERFALQNLRKGRPQV